MVFDWYPKEKKALEALLKNFLSRAAKEKSGEMEKGVKVERKIDTKEIRIRGVIVPHAGYVYSGDVAAKAYFFLNDYMKNYMKKQKKNNLKNNLAIVFGPSHYMAFEGVWQHNQNTWQTPLGKTKVINAEIPEIKKVDISYEHSIDNQIPFLQAIGMKAILPLCIGKLTLERAKFYAEKIFVLREELSKNYNIFYVFSTDLSHFYNYNTAIRKDKNIIKIIEECKIKNFDEIDACGKFPLAVLLHLCMLENLKPSLLAYKTSAEITKDYSSVVGYAAFVITQM